MSEMLGNQYFMARNYASAQHEFEDCLEQAPDNLHIVKKLIICYTQTGRISKALSYFSRLIDKDISLIIDTEPVKEDCPCPELVQNLEKGKPQIVYSFDYYIILGIIWLYCDAGKSLENFRKAKSLNDKNPEVNKIINKISEYIINNSSIS